MAGPWASPSQSLASSIIGQGRLSSHSGRKSEANGMPETARTLHCTFATNLGGARLFSVNLKGKERRQGRKEAAIILENFVFHFPLLAPWAPRENGRIPQERRFGQRLSKATCPRGSLDVLKCFSNVWAPKLSNVPAAEHAGQRCKGACFSDPKQLGPHAFRGAPHPCSPFRSGITERHY